jgi:hypothetical protein
MTNVSMYSYSPSAGASRTDSKDRYTNRLQYGTTAFKDALFSSYLTYHWIFDECYTRGATNGS